MSWSRLYLSAILQNPGLIDPRITNDDVEDQYRELHKAIRESIIDGEPVDTFHLSAKYKAQQWWPGAAAVSDMELEGMPSMVKRYADEVIEESQGRKLRSWLEKAPDIVRRSKSHASAISNLQSCLIALHSEGNLPLEPLSKVMAQGQTEARYVTTGVIQIDKAWLLDCGGLHIVAGRPGMGKTAYAVWLATRLLAQGKSVIFFSLEMPKRQILARLASTWSDLDSHANDPLWISDQAAQNVEDIAMASSLLKGRCDCIMIDYMQLIRTSNRHDNREQTVSYICGSLKKLARDMDVPVIVMCQLNRICESTSDRRPMLSHLRESGSIEQDADSVSLIYRPEYYSRIEGTTCPKELVNAVEINIAKQRNRDTVSLCAMWTRENGQWSAWREGSLQYKSKKEWSI